MTALMWELCGGDGLVLSMVMWGVCVLCVLAWGAWLMKREA